MCNKLESVDVDWSDVIVLFNSLIRSIETLRNEINSGTLNEDDLYDAEEELNDYVVVVARLRHKYNELENKGELTFGLSQRLKQIC